MTEKMRLVNAEAVARKLKSVYCAECNATQKVQCSACWVNDVLDLLEGDDVDAVEVPCRCKECRYSVQDHPYDPMECMKWKTKWGVAYTTPDGYCHKGERKNNA